MKIYTKRGDAGKTDVIGKRVSKDDSVIWIIGTLDEAASLLSFAKTSINDLEVIDEIDSLYKLYNSISYELAGGPQQITEEIVSKIEQAIDKFNSRMPELKEFITFDKNEGAAKLNVARTIIRKAERLIVSYNETKEINKYILQYINRASDLLFVLARLINK